MPLTFRHDVDSAADDADSGLVVDRVPGAVEAGGPCLGVGQRVLREGLMVEVREDREVDQTKRAVVGRAGRAARRGSPRSEFLPR